MIQQVVETDWLTEIQGVPRAGGPLLWLSSTAQAGWQDIPNLSQLYARP